MTPLMPHVVALVDKMGGEEGVSVDDLMPYCPGHTRREVMQALHSATNRKKVEIKTPARRIAIGTGSLPGTYVTARWREESNAQDGPLVHETGPRGQLWRIGRVASVWELGGRDNSEEARAA